LRCNPGSRRKRTTYALRHSSGKGCTGTSLPRLRNEPWIAGYPGARARPSQRGPSGKVTCQSCESHFTPFRYKSFTHTPKTKSPERLRGPGPWENRSFDSAVSRGRTRALLAILQAIGHRPLPAHGRARPLQISNCCVSFHRSLNHKGANCGALPS
jgi:hypothetical protein